ncbi:glutamine amidotransferase subunit [Martiniozyma asiatica (nom. inval.)]|nr:glutamine amidotransferase subunit [Martiniozyma asiatica]
MCRFLIYKGKDSINLADLLTKPQHSIINQSYDSRLRIDSQPVNGDGFGVGYYTPTSNCPCLYKAITPAWNNQNLQRLSEKTNSNLVFAHVRASTYGVLSETNCHPFIYNNLMFMHNGGVCDFRRIKKRLVNFIDENFFLEINGSTDSECCFALVLHCLSLNGFDPSSGKNCDVEILRKSLVDAIQYIKVWTNELPDKSSDPSLLNFALTDGESIVASRYITSVTDEAASLYFSTGSNFIEYSPGRFKVERLNRSQNLIMVASEPLTFERGDWISVPTNSTISISNFNVLLHPILDEYYTSHTVRSADYACSKGMIGVVPKPQDSSVPPLLREGRQASI